MIIEDEEQNGTGAQYDGSDFIVDCCWAHFYATGEDLPIKILLKIAAQRVEIEEPHRERKEFHVKRIQGLALDSLRTQPFEHTGLIRMYENILALDKSMLKQQVRFPSGCGC